MVEVVGIEPTAISLQRKSATLAVTPLVRLTGVEPAYLLLRRELFIQLNYRRILCGARCMNRTRNR